MGMLTVKDELLKRIAKIADANHLTIEVQAEKLLIDSIRRAEARQEIIQRAEAVASMTPKDVRQTDSVVLLREDRSR